MYSGLNNKLANVPTITGLSNVVADQVVTDTLIVDGNDVGSIIVQVPINTANIATLQQITTGQTYASVGDTTTFDNNVTLTTGKTMTADNFVGLASNASQVTVTTNNLSSTYYPVFAGGTSSGQKQLQFDTSTTPFSYTPDTSLLQMGSFSTTNNSSIKALSLGSKNGATIFMTYGSGIPALTTGDFNVIIGGNIGTNLAGGSNNFAMGYNCFNANINGCNNCLMGHRAGLSLGASGNFYTWYNTCVGDTSLTNANDVAESTCIGSNTGGSMLNGNLKCSCIGASTDCGDGLSYATAIGADVLCSTSNTVQIGRAADNTIFDGTVTMKNTASITTNGISPTSTLRIADSGTTNAINFLPNAGGGSYNFLTEAGDTLIMSGNSALDVADLTIAPYSSTLSGIRITPSTTFIGVGGASTTRTAGVTCSGTNVGITGTLTLNNNLILTTPSTTLTQTELSYLYGVTSNIQSQFNAINPANFVTTNTVQNITANKTMYGASLLIDNGTGNNTTLSHVNQILNLKNNNTNSTVSVTGVVPSQALNRIVPTDGSNPTTAQILNTTITGDNIPNQTNTYFVSAHAFNTSIQISTLGVPAGQIGCIGITLTAGMFITSNLGTNFSNGTYVTGTAPGVNLYFINQNALNTTLNKVAHNFSTITTNITLSAAVASGTINFNNFGKFQFLTNNGGGAQIMPLSIDATETDVNVPFHVNNTATFFQAVDFRQNNITLGSGNVVNLGSGAGSNLTNLVCGLTNARSIVFGTGGNTVLGGDAGNNLSTVAANNTLVGYSAGRSITSTGSSNVCVGKDAGRGISTGIQNTMIGTQTGFQTSGGTGNNNVCIGFGTGDAMTTSAAQNTLIGTDTGGALTTGSANTIVGFGAGTGLLTGINNTIMGIEAGDNITGNYNICIGSGSSVPTAAGGNQISIGTATETMFIQGGFNWRFGGVITNSTNGNLSGVTMGQYYTVTMAAVGSTITLPDPAAAANLGKVVIFKRKQNNTAFTLTSTGGAGFIPTGSITLSASPHLVATSVYQITLVADGLNWAIINQA